MKKNLFVFVKIGTFLILFMFFSFYVGILISFNGLPAHGVSLKFFIQYICGFPLVLINDQYPFFVDSGNSVSLKKFWFMSSINIICQTAIVFLFYKILIYFRNIKSKGSDI